MTAQTPERAKVEAFIGRLVDVLNSGSLALMLSIGHQTGLFDTMARLAPATSVEIAKAAKLNERYVREWLGAMVTGRIVEYDPEGGTYHLPAEHAAALTRAAGTDNMASEMQNIALLAGVEQEVITCFREGGGVPYERFPRFQQVMAEESTAVIDASLIRTTLPLVPGLPERLRAGIDVLDIGCGSGHAINVMAQAFPSSRFTGYDFSSGGIAAAIAEAEQMHLTNATFEEKDLRSLDDEARFDLITAFDVIHDQAQPRQVLKSVAHALGPGGTFLMVDIAASSNVQENIGHLLCPYLYTISTMHCMTVSLALNGEGLGTVWGEQKARELLAEAGFTHVEVRHVPADVSNSYYIATRD